MGEWFTGNVIQICFLRNILLIFMKILLKDMSFIHISTDFSPVLQIRPKISPDCK